MGDIDIVLPNMLQHTIYNILHIISIVVMISIGTPWMLVFFFLLLIWYFAS